jgi:hypothetical protein
MKGAVPGTLLRARAWKSYRAGTSLQFSMYTTRLAEEPTATLPKLSILRRRLKKGGKRDRLGTPPRA